MARAWRKKERKSAKMEKEPATQDQNETAHQSSSIEVDSSEEVTSGNDQVNDQENSENMESSSVETTIETVPPAGDSEASRLKAENEELKDKFLRALADCENLRKR